MIKKLLLISVFVLSIVNTYAQSTFAPLNEDYYHLIDRYEIKNVNLDPNLHTSFKEVQRKHIAQFADSILVDSTQDKVDLFNLKYLQSNN